MQISANIFFLFVINIFSFQQFFPNFFWTFLFLVLFHVLTSNTVFVCVFPDRVTKLVCSVREARPVCIFISISVGEFYFFSICHKSEIKKQSSI